MKRLPISLMLMDVFAGILAALMLFVAGLLGILILVNAVRGEDANTSSLLLLAMCFAVGGAGFYALKRWAKRVAGTSSDTSGLTATKN